MITTTVEAFWIERERERPVLQLRRWREGRPREWAKHSPRRDRRGRCTPSVFCSPTVSDSPLPEQHWVNSVTRSSSHTHTHREDRTAKRRGRARSGWTNFPNVRLNNSSSLFQLHVYWRFCPLTSSLLS